MSTLKVNTLQTAAGVEVYTAKAWVNFNGTGTVAIRASGNVTSITDNGTGDYTVNFTNAMTDANYSAIATPNAGSSAIRTAYGVATPTTSAYRLECSDSGTTRTDVSFISVAIFR